MLPAGTVVPAGASWRMSGVPMSGRPGIICAVAKRLMNLTFSKGSGKKPRNGVR
jgi:hypothetical protein